MTGKPFPSRLLDQWRHPSSPISLVVVCVGFWLPIDLLNQSNRLQAIQSTLEQIRVIATAVVWNAVLSALAAIFLYLAAALVAAAFRMPLQKTAETALHFAVYATAFIPCLQLLRVASFIPDEWWKQGILITTVVLVALWMIRANVQLARFLFLPKLLTTLLLPISLLFVAQEAISGFHSSRIQASFPAGVSDQQHPDIILITIDTLSAQHLHTYGYNRLTSPNLDAFSGNAIVFDNFYANANWTRPGIASILNGVRPWSHEGDVSTPPRALTDRQNLLKVLDAAGYDLNVVQSNEWADFGSQGIDLGAHRIFLGPRYRFLHWFPTEKLRSAAIAESFALPSIIDRFESNFLRPIANKGISYLPASEELLRQSSSRHPLFFWLHIVIPHSPYSASPPFLGTFDASPNSRTASTSQAYLHFAKDIDQHRQNLLKARYDEAVLQTDSLIGNVIQMLKQEGRFDRSLIVVTADHGESFNPLYGDHGGPLLTEEIIRVPCLIKPASPYTPKREPQLMEQADLVPTILLYAGLPLPTGSEGQPYQTKPANLPVFSMNRDLQNRAHTLNVAMREGDWKYVIHFGHWNYPWPKQELYDLAIDPDERTNLTNSQPERAAAMRQRIVAEIARHGISLREYQH